MKHLGLKHEIDYNLALLRYVGITPSARALCVPLKGDAEERVRLLLRAGAIADTDAVIAINPGASCPSKRWPPDRFAKVGKALMAEVGAKIVIVAGEADRKLGEATASLIGKGCLDLSGKTSVADLASVLKRARLFISNDSGPVHIACAAGTPVVAIFGRNDRGLSPRRWGPSGKEALAAIFPLVPP